MRTSLATAFYARTEPLGNDGLGHLRWTGPTQPASGRARLHLAGASYSVLTAAYLIRTGHQPIGRPHTLCGQPGCIAPDHVGDEDEPRHLPASPAPPRLWQDRAACVGHDPALFDPGPTDWDTIRRAKAICGICPVKVACLRAAEAEERGAQENSRATIRGGYTAAERVRIHRHYTPAKSPARKKETAA